MSLVLVFFSVAAITFCCTASGYIPRCSMTSDCAHLETCVVGKCVRLCQPAEDECGVNTHCLVVNGEVHCACRQGFTGDPTTGCQAGGHTPRCSDNTKCAHLETCVVGKCVRLCQRAEDACGVNTHCLVVNGEVHCACRQGFTGDPTTGCHQSV